MSRWPDSDARLEDARWMAETGECLDGAARRLGLTRNTLEKFLYRHDRDLLAVLVSHQPRDHNLVAEMGAVASTPRAVRVREQKRRRRHRQQEGVAA